MRLRLLSADDIDRSLSINEAIEVIAQAFAFFSFGKAILPMRESIEMPLRTTLFMPAYLKTGALALKGGLRISGEFQGRTSHCKRPCDRSGFPDRPASGSSGRSQADGPANRVRAVAAIRSLEEIRIYTPSGVSARRLAERLKRSVLLSMSG